MIDTCIFMTANEAQNLMWMGSPIQKLLNLFSIVNINIYIRGVIDKFEIFLNYVNTVRGTNK